MWDSSQVFSFDPTSTITACAVKHGGVDDGSLTYSGIKSSAPEAKRTLAVAPMAKQFSAYADVVSHQRLKDFIATAFPESSGPMTSGDDNNVSGIVGNPQGWNAIVKWLAGSNPNVVLAGSGVIVYAMIQKGYKATYHEVQKADGTVEVDFGIQPGQGGGEILGDVPPKVLSDWNAAVQQAMKYKPINEGIVADS